MRHKKPAPIQVGLEIDRDVIATYGNAFDGLCTVIKADAIEWLTQAEVDEETLIYVDPPYYPATRRRKRVYRYDYNEKDHEKLLTLLLSLPAKVMISGYDNPLYQEMLRDWNRYSFMAPSHAGKRKEFIWFNYLRPVRLHDDRYIGKNFREREIIKRRQQRLKERLLKLSVTERASIHAWLGRQLNQEVIS